MTFDGSYTLDVGGQRLMLEYHGVNHEQGNLFIYAPRQKVLMLVDVIYPGFVPYKNLGIAEDVHGYIAAHRQALAFDFDLLVAGHVNRLGTRKDVEVSLEFVGELRGAAAAELHTLEFPAYVRSHPAGDNWDLHHRYERELAARCVARLRPRWEARLADASTYLEHDCWAMLEALIVELPEEGP